MYHILLVDGDPITIDTFGSFLRTSGYEVATALTGRAGLQTALNFKPDIALIDQRLPDMSGIEMLSELRARMPSIACVMVMSFGTPEVMVEAMRQEACDWLSKPVWGEDLLSTVLGVLASHTRPEAGARLAPAPKPHALARLAETTVRFAQSPDDKRVLREIGHEVGHAAGCLRNWCHTAKLKARSFRDFCRALRAVLYLETHNASQETANLLEIVDERTIKRFSLKAGGTKERLPATVDEFLDRQQFINNPEFVAAVRTALRSVQLSSPVLN